MRTFVKDFVRSSGLWVGSAVIISKICVFLALLVVVRLLSKDDFGSVSIALNFLAFFLALTGGGMYQGVLRFGAIARGEERKKLLAYAFAKGVLLQIAVTVFVFIVSFLVYRDSANILFLISILLLRFIGIFFLEQGKAEARANFDNKKFSLLDIVSSVSFLVLACVLTYFFGLKGYLGALCISPFTVFLFHKFEFSTLKPTFSQFTEREFWNQAVVTAMATQIGEWIFLLDVFFIGMFLDNSQAAEFRVSNTIPMNLMFVSIIFLQTGYPELCRNFNNKAFQKNYLVNYFKTVIPIAVVIIVVISLFGAPLMLLFGPNYNNPEILRILVWVSISVLLIRAPFSYALAALGKPHYTLWVSAAIFLILSVAYYFITPVYGIVGVAWINVLGVTLSGILYATAYMYELKKI